MFDHIETLIHLEEEETMTATALKLRLTQSAVSKRIDQLEAFLGKQLIEKKGRRVYLTPQASQLTQRIKPLFSQMRTILFEEEQQGHRKISLGISESILCSWGGKLLKSLQKKFPRFQLELHTHRAPVVIGKVRSGEYAFGLCPGEASQDPHLICDNVGSEKMAIIHENKWVQKDKPLDILTIETNSETWKSLKDQVHKFDLKPKRTMESFSVIARLSAQGMGPGLVPYQLAKSLKIPERLIHPLNLNRPISLITKKSHLTQGDLADFYLHLTSTCKLLLNK